MANQGVVPKDKLEVGLIGGPIGDILSVRNKAPSDQPQEWVSITLKGDNIQKVEVTAVDSKGKKIVTKSLTVTDPSKPFEVKFDEPVPADRLSILVYAIKEGPTNVEVVSAVACVRAPADEETTVAATTPGAGTTTPGQTAVPSTTTVPGTTTTVPGTTVAVPTTPASGQTTVAATTGAVTTVAPTTSSPATTPASRPKPVCLQQMENQGVVPKDKLKVTRVVGPKSTTLTVESPVDDKFSPVWVTLNVKSPSKNAKEVTLTPVDKEYKPVGESQKKTVSDPTKLISVTFDTPVEAKKVIVVVTPSTDKPSDVDIVSAEACIFGKVATTTPAAGTTTVASGTTAGTTAGTTTVAPGTTAGTTVGTTPAVTTTTTRPITTVPKIPPTPLVCTSPLEASECLCHRTCDSLAEGAPKCPALGSSECHRGCQCPAGTVMLGGKCVKEIDCPCYYKGKFYKTNDRVAVDSVHCTYMVCTSEGMKKIVDKECKPNVVCASGRQFQLCPCERSCTDEKHTCDQTTCQPGCACPVDTVWNGVECVVKAQCTCKEGNVTYTNGQSWDHGECSKCHCVNGVAKCSEICTITAETCKKQGKTLLNKDLRDGVCCRCVSEEPHCLYEEQEKKIGEIWHEGLCTHYKCSKTVLGTGMITKTKTECAECEADEVKEYVANKCCPVCRKKATTSVTPKEPETPFKGERCSEVMKDTKEMNDKRITLTPAKNAKPTDISPRGKGWTVSIEEKPTVTLDLSTDKGQRPGVLQTLRVLGNAKSVTIKYTDVRPSAEKPETFKDYNKGKPIDVEKSVVRLVSPSSGDTGITVYKVQITVVEAVDRTKPLTLRLKVHACIEDAPEPCDESDLEELVCLEIMKSPSELPNKRITLEPRDKGTASDIRPSGKGWKVDEDDSPVVTINLASKDGKKPGLVEKLGVIGNVKTAFVEYRPVRLTEGVVIKGASKDGFVSYNDGKPVEVEKSEVVLKSPVTQKSGLIAYDIRVTPAEPVVEDESYNLKLKVYACIQVDYNDVKEPKEDEPRKPKKGEPEEPKEPTDSKKPEEPTGCAKVLENGELPEDRITLKPKDKGTPSVLFPSGKGWPVDKEDKPQVTINFASPDGRKPGLVDKITVLGNVKTVKVEVQEIRPREDRKIKPEDKLRPDSFIDFKDGKPVDVEKKPIVFKDPITDKPGRVVYQVRLTPLEPIHPDKPMNMRLRIVACVQDKKPNEPKKKDPSKPKKPTDDSTPKKPNPNGSVDDKRVKLYPTNKGEPKDVLPSGKGWPVTKEDKPTITINLASPDGKKPGLLDDITVLGNVKTADFEVQKIRPRENRKIDPNDEMDPEGFKDYNDKPVDVTKKPVVFKSKVTKKPGVLVYQVRITPVEPIDPTKPFDMKVRVNACIQGKTAKSCDKSDDKPKSDTPKKPKKPESDNDNKPVEPTKPTKLPESNGCVDVMKDPEELPDDHVILKPTDKGTPKDLRPKGKGWPVTKDDKPVIVVNLANKDNKKPGLLRRIKVLGNVKEVGVRYRTIRPRKDRKIQPTDKVDPQGFQDFNNGKPVNVRDLDLVFKDPVSKQPGVMVYDVEITLLEPVKPEKPFDAKLKVYACIQNDLELITRNELQELINYLKGEKLSKPAKKVPEIVA